MLSNERIAMLIDGFDLPALKSIAEETGFPVKLADGDVPVVVGKRRREVTKTLRGGYDLWSHMGVTTHMKSYNVSREEAVEFLMK